MTDASAGNGVRERLEHGSGRRSGERGADARAGLRGYERYVGADACAGNALWRRLELGSGRRSRVGGGGAANMRFEALFAV